MASPDDSLPAIREALTARYGRPEPFAPGDDAFEAMVAAFLDRALDAPKRARAVDALRDGGLLDPQALAEADPAEVGEALRSAGLKVQDRALAPLRQLSGSNPAAFRGSSRRLSRQSSWPGNWCCRWGCRA